MDKITDIYHAYFWRQLSENNEPLSFEDWFTQVWQPFLSGRELVLTNTN